MTRIRRALALMLATGAAVLATALPAQADPTPRALVCPFGYVCLYPGNTSAPILVRQGESRQFPGGIKAALANRTTVTYCVLGQLSFALPPFTDVVEPRDVRALGPMPPGGACLM